MLDSVQRSACMGFKTTWRALFGRHLIFTNVIGGAALAYLGDLTRQKTMPNANGTYDGHPITAKPKTARPPKTEFTATILETMNTFRLTLPKPNPKSKGSPKAKYSGFAVMGARPYGKVDHHQSRCMALVSMPLSLEMHFWYKFLDRVFPTRSKGDIVRKLLCDELFMAPNFTFTLITGLSYLEKKTWDEYWKRIKESFGLLYLLDICFFTPIQLLNFYFFPTKYRTLVLYFAAIAYYYVASFILHESH